MATSRKQSSRLIRLREVMRLTGLSRPSIYRLGRAGKFPPPVKLTERATAWQEALVEDWIAARCRAHGSLQSLPDSARDAS